MTVATSKAYKSLEEYCDGLDIKTPFWNEWVADVKDAIVGFEMNRRELAYFALGQYHALRRALSRPKSPHDMTMIWYRGLAAKCLEPSSESHKKQVRITVGSSPELVKALSTLLK